MDSAVSGLCLLTLQLTNTVAVCTHIHTPQQEVTSLLLCLPLSSSSFFRSVVKAKRFLQDQEQTSGMEGQCVLFGRFPHSHTYANSMMKPQETRGQEGTSPGNTKSLNEITYKIILIQIKIKKV